MIEVDRLCAAYGRRQVLHEVSARFRPGVVTAVVGPNGCGKSTQLKAVVGLCRPSSGQVRLGGAELASLSSREAAQRVAYLPQSRNIPDITALRMVLHGRFAHLSYPRRYRPEDYACAQRALEWVGAGELAPRLLKGLSGGQRQKVYIAMTLAQDTPAVLMDEPTTYLDVRGQLEVLRLSRRLARMGKAVVLVLHDLGSALEWADELLVLREGRAVAAGTPGEAVRSGELERTFRISLHAADTSQGRRYFCGFPEGEGPGS